MAFTRGAAGILVACLFTVGLAADKEFSNDLLVDFYGRFFEIVPGAPTSQPCASIVQHFKEGNSEGDGTYTIPHSSIFMGGNNCGKGEMVMTDTPSENEFPSVGESSIVFKNLQDSEGGFWVGESERNCGKWNLPSPTIVFMVKDDSKDLTGPYEVMLPKGGKYMIFTNKEFTCIYKDVAAPSPKPSPVAGAATGAASTNSAGTGIVTGSSGGDNETYSAVESFNDGDILGVPTTVLPKTKEEEAEASPEEEEDDGSACFPADATVELENGSIKTMEKLELGDRVKVSSNDFSDVFMFTHKVADSVSEFVKISTASGAELSVTKGHYLYVNGALAAAKTVQTGDVLELGSGLSTTVEAVSCATSRGIFNPQTISGDIIVNGVRASTYTTAVEPAAAHKLLAPFRALYSGLGVTTAVFENGANTIAKIAPKGLPAY